MLKQGQVGRAGRCWDNPFSLPCSRGAQRSSSCCLPSPLCGPSACGVGLSSRNRPFGSGGALPGRAQPRLAALSSHPPRLVSAPPSRPTVKGQSCLPIWALSSPWAVGWHVKVSDPEKHRRVGGDRGTCWVQQSGPGTLVRTVPTPPPTDPTVVSPAAHFVFLGHSPQLPIIALHLTHAGCWASKGRTSSWGTCEALGLGGFSVCSELLVPRALAASALLSLSFPIVYPVSRVTCVV